jgi:hypothetical protein
MPDRAFLWLLATVFVAGTVWGLGALYLMAWPS